MERLEQPMLRFDSDGHCSIDFGMMDEASWEAICPVCNGAIRWRLDVMSFTMGSKHELAHARCIWSPERLLHEVTAARLIKGAEAMRRYADALEMLRKKFDVALTAMTESARRQLREGSWTRDAGLQSEGPDQPDDGSDDRA